MTDDERVDERRWWTLGILCLSLVMIIVGNTVLNVALPTLIREIDATSSDLQWMVDAYALVFAGLLLTGGALGDRFGRKGALTIGLVIFGVASILASVSSSAAQVIATRGLMGIGAALVMPATLSILVTVFPPHERGRAIGVWAGLAGAGAAIGPIAGGWLLEHFWWGSVFLVNLPVIAVALVGGHFLVPTSRDPRKLPLDPVGAALSIGALGSILYAIIEAPAHGWTGEATLVAAGIGLAFGLAFAFWELRAPFPMLDLRFFRNPRFSSAAAAIMLVFFALFGTFFLLTQYLQLVRGYSALQAGIHSLPAPITIMVMAPMSSKLVERFGTRAVIAFGLAVVGVGLGLASTLGLDTPYVLLAASLVILATGMALSMAPATTSIMTSLPLGKAGVGSAVNDTTRELGGALGVAVLGSLVASHYASSIGELAGFAGPPGDVARQSLGAALQVAASAGERGPELAAAARGAFVDAMNLAFVVAAAVALGASLMIARFMPSRHDPRGVHGAGVEPDPAPGQLIPDVAAAAPAGPAGG
jgi:EmrB/QacA subfamily drug resistance transporter